MECSCEICKYACKRKPGWFLPEEITNVSNFLNITEQELFDNFLAVDYYLGDNTIFVLSPSTKTNITGEEFPYDPIGECIFYKDGLCSIHSVKPHECKFYDHTKSNKKSNKKHLEIAEQWINKEEKIINLLGRKPILPEANYSNLLFYDE